MISNNFKSGKFNVKHKDGYYLVSQTEIKKEGVNIGEEYETNLKTFVSDTQARDYLLSNGIAEGNAIESLSRCYSDYLCKVYDAWVIEKARKEKAKAKKENNND